MKPWESNPLLHVSILGYDAWTIRVAGGVAWTKWLTTLTGESPTSSAAWLRLATVIAVNPGCALGPVISKVVFEDEHRLVRLDVTYRTGGQEHSHPVTLDPDVLMAALQAMTVTGRGSLLSGRLGANPPVLPQAFSEEQVQFFAPLLARALDRASPLEEIVFYVNEPRGSGIREISSGSFYVQGEDLHLILANYRYAVAGELMAEKARANPLIVLGESWYQVTAGPQGRIEPSGSWKGMTGTAPQHLVMLNIKNRLPVNKAPGRTTSQEVDKFPHQPTSVAEKLRMLRALKEAGLLTLQEFETKQRQVIDSETAEGAP